MSDDLDDRLGASGELRHELFDFDGDAPLAAVAEAEESRPTW